MQITSLLGIQWDFGVIAYVFFYRILELIEAAVYLPVVHLLLHDPKEILHW